MRNVLVLTIINLVRQMYPLRGFVAVTIVCFGALVVVTGARARGYRGNLGHEGAREGAPLHALAIIAARFSRNSSHPAHPSSRHAPPLHDPFSPVAGAPFLTTYPLSPTLTRGESPSEGRQAPSGNPFTAPAGATMPESRPAPPIWRRVETLLDGRHATALTLTGEAPGKAILIKVAPPIWRDVSVLHEVAQLESASAGQEAVCARAPRPPIWRAVELQRRAGMTLASTPLRLAHDDKDYVPLSGVATAPPIWAPLPGSRAEARTLSPAEDQTDASARSGTDKPPIWSSFMHP